MNTRTIIFTGNGYGNVPAEIIATYNGNVVYSGEVLTLDEPMPTLPDLDLAIEDTLFQVENVPIDFAGTVPVTIQVTKGEIITADTISNYMTTSINGETVSSGPDQYIDVNGAGECRTNVFIDGVEQNPDRTELSGTWWYKLTEGSTITFDLEVIQGLDVPTV